MAAQARREKDRAAQSPLDGNTICNYNLGVRFEWDEAKRRANLRKHGIDFADAVQVFDGITVTIEDTRFDYGETRFLTLGLLRAHVVVIAHTETEEVIRLISVRKATKNEEANYYKEIPD